MTQLIDKDKIPNYALNLEIEKGNKKDKMKTRIAFWDDIEKLPVIESTTPVFMEMYPGSIIDTEALLKDHYELLVLRKAYELVCDVLVNNDSNCSEGCCLFADECSDEIECNNINWVKEFFINKVKEKPND